MTTAEILQLIAALATPISVLGGVWMFMWGMRSDVQELKAKLQDVWVWREKIDITLSKQTDIMVDIASQKERMDGFRRDIEIFRADIKELRLMIRAIQIVRHNEGVVLPGPAEG